MSTPNDNDAFAARNALRGSSGAEAAKAYATLALADAITTAARTLARGMIEAARIRRGQA